VGAVMVVGWGGCGVVGVGEIMVCVLFFLSSVNG
jgi:hypothetical protein